MEKTTKIEAIIILVIGVVFFLIDIGTFTYCNKKVYPVLLLHHILNIFAQFGFLCTDKTLLTLYVFAPILTMLHWKTNNNKCFLTQYVNDACGYDMYFRDLWFLLGIKTLENYSQIHYAYLIAGWIIAVMKLSYSVKK